MKITSYEALQALQLPSDKHNLFCLAWDDMRTENGRRALVSLLGHAVPLKTKQTAGERRAKQSVANKARRDSYRFKITYEPLEASPLFRAAMPVDHVAQGMNRAARCLNMRESSFDWHLIRSAEKTVSRVISNPRVTTAAHMIRVTATLLTESN